MRSAPSVDYPVPRSCRAGAALLALWCLGTLPVIGWLALASPSALTAAAILAWVLLAGSVCAWHWWRAPDARLVWDGQSWNTDQVVDARLVLSIDLQSLMILRLSPAAGGAQWLFVDRAARPVAWHTLRCAVTASKGERTA
ncbi:hypothetical protein GN316_16275 [Xylophilus sp. Kf1]|nr:hypothetical protein [Xylophilus sp. Kf1]